MSFHLSAWSIKHPVPTIVLFLILAILGIWAFLTLEIDQDPNIDIPAIAITVTQSGASPAELETQVTRKIEDAVVNLDKLDKILSTVSDETSQTTLEFVLGTSTDQALNEVRNVIAQIRPDLPQNIDAPIIQQLTFTRRSVMAYAVTSEQRTITELSEFVDRKVSRTLLKVPGVHRIQRLGGVDRAIRVDLDSSRLEALAITATQVNDQIRQLNLNLSGGRSEIGGKEQNVRTLGSAKTVTDLKAYRIVLPNGETVPLASLGNVEDSFTQPRQAAYFNGKPVVAFSVRRSSGSTLVTVEQGVQKAVTTLEKTLPDDIHLHLIFTRANFIQDSYQATIDALILGSVLTVVTVGLFLRSWQVTLITAIALPLSIIPTFGVIKALGYTLNLMTLLALALAIGNLVDDAICMSENIDQHLQTGQTPWQAALDGAREIGLAVVATTATIVAVFIPVAFMGGIPGQYFQPFGITVAVSTMFSTLVATTITPMLSARLLKPKLNSNPTRADACSHHPYLSTQRRQPYRQLLTWALKHRMTTLLTAIAFFLASIQLVSFIPKGLFNEGDTGFSTLLFELPPSAKLNDSITVMEKITQLSQANSAVENVLAAAESVNQGVVYITLVPKGERALSQQAFEEQMRPIFRKIPGARISFRSGSGDEKDLSLVLKSDNPSILKQVSQDLEQQMRRVPGLVEVTSSLGLVKPEMIIEPHIERAADLGVSVEAIAQTASLALIGDDESDLAKFNLPDRQIPIRVHLAPEQRGDINTLKNLLVPSNNGNLVPLIAVADIRLGSGPAEIKRFNRSRQISLGANLQAIALGDALDRVKSLPAMNPLPPEVFEEPDGDAKIMQDVFSRFLGALGLAILSIYAILVLLYNNFGYPLVILGALPLSLGGVLLGLFVTQKELGLFALIGMILLMGLVTKNAILLVDFALASIQQGTPLFKAVVKAGVSRLRPILMTSLSTVAGMAPIALELGAAGEMRSPMAIAVIGGFTTSTLLTLVVIPVIFTYMKNFQDRIFRLFNKGSSLK